ncbi:sporulation protein [Pueribacillus theae]|uniref:Sporulation protein n=1 Tax=Pueribacillus theae TaxID=2171751 RepID=A0A2U1K4S0_9BACI|nr:GerMN domain-containing protein [Pueribacillus theae]PWA12265.1 sporulation protein [Pueribacillus theae]
MRKRFKFAFLLLLSLLLFIIAGCGLIGKNREVDIDPPKDVSLVDENEDGELADDKEESAKTSEENTADAEKVKRQLFLIDEKGMVVPQMLEIPVPESKEVATQALEYLVKDGPVSELLPNGFQAVLPAGTQVLGVNIKDDTAIADFSEEFKEYQAADEQKILQAITWTLTQFDNINKVKIRINGHDQEVMPVDGTPISGGVSREDGINIDSGSVTDLSDSVGVTLYFLAQSGENRYYVPVTKRVAKNEENDKVAAAVNGLIEGPSLQSGLFSDFPKEVEILDILKDSEGLLTLDFNEAILDNQKAISDEALHSLVLTLTENEDIKEIAINVNGEANVLTESGKPLSQPVTRDMVSETKGF